MRPLKHEAAEIQRFVVDYFESIGGVVEFTGYSLAEVLIPDEFAPHFDDRTFLRMAFDPEVAQENRDAEFIIYGSHFLDKLTTLATARGLTTIRYMVVDRLQPGRAVEKLTKRFSFIGCNVALKEGLVKNFYYILFNFKIVYLTDEREEAFESVLINLNTNRAANKLGAIIDTSLCSQTREVICPDTDTYSIWDAYQTACSELRDRAESDFRTRQEDNRRRLSIDLRRINQYYDDLKRELEARLEKVKDGPKRTAAIKQKLSANELEWRRREKELEDKYKLRIHIKLNNTVLYSQPKVINEFTLSRRDMERSLQVVWDPLLKEFEPPICQVCGEELKTIQLDHNGGIVCWRSQKR